MTTRSAYIALNIAVLSALLYGGWNVHTAYHDGAIVTEPQAAVTEAQTTFRAGAIAGIPLFYEPVKDTDSRNNNSRPSTMPTFELTGVMLFHGDESMSRAFIITGGAEKALHVGDEITPGLKLTAIGAGKITVLFDGKERDVLLAGEKHDEELIVFVTKEAHDENS